MSEPNLIHVNPYEVMFVITRERDKEHAGAQVKESIRQMGVRMPLKVQSIIDWPVEKRRRPDGGTYKWRALFGQGRCEYSIELYEETQDASYLRVPAEKVENANAATIASAFLTENLLRKEFSWMEQAQLMRGDIEAMPGGMTKANVARLAKAYFVTPSHVVKLLRLLQKLNPAVEKELKGLTIQEAETLTALPTEGQNIVLETLREEGLPKAELAAVVRRAKSAAEEGAPLSKTALRANLRRLREDLEKARATAKPLRLHYALGPENLRVLLADKQWRKRLEKEGVGFAKFEEASR